MRDVPARVPLTCQTQRDVILYQTMFKERNIPNNTIERPRAPWFLRSRGRTYAILLLVLALPAAVLSVLVAMDVSSELRLRAERENALAATMVARAVNERFDGLTRYVQSYADRIKFSEAVCLRDAATARLSLTQMVAGNPLVSRVFLADTSGVIWVDLPSDPQVLGQSFAHRDWYQGVARGVDVYVSEIYRRQALGQPYTIAIAARVYSPSGIYCGILVAQVTVDDLARWFFDLRLPEGRRVALLDQRGHWLDNSNTNVDDSQFVDTTLFAHLISDPLTFAQAPDPLTGVKSIINVAPISSVGWTVVARRELAHVAAPAREIQHTILLYFAIGLLGMIFVARSTHGTLQRYDEDRAAALRELEHAYHDVERRVEMRTKELVSANAELQRMAAIIESSNDAIGTMTLDGIVTSWNPSAERIYGYSHRDVIGRHASIFLPEDRCEETAELLKRLKNGETVERFETVRRRQDGRLIDVSLLPSPVYDSEGNITAVSIISLDITQQKAIERQTRQLEREREELLERLQMTLDRMPIGCTLFDPALQFTYFNPAAEQIFGYRLDDVLGKNPIGLITPESSRAQVLDIVRKLSLGAAALDSVDENLTRDGRRITCVWNYTSLRARDGEFLGIIAMCRDITEQKQDEERLRLYAAALASSNRELQDFAFVASHDLQEPLRKILAFGERLGEANAGILNEESRDYLARMQNAAQRMQGLIRDLLDFSRVTTRAQPFAETNLRKVADEVISDLETRIEQTMGRVDIGELPTIEADRLQMRQLIQNLISNALKFHRLDTPPRVRVEARLLPPSSDSALGTMCELSFVDNGIGFDQKYSDRIFSQFQRLHGRHEYEGTGMGLAICRKIVERHNGTISAASKPGEGSCFIVTLPVKQPEAGRTLWATSDAPSASSSPTTIPTTGS